MGIRKKESSNLVRCSTSTSTMAALDIEIHGTRSLDFPGILNPPPPPPKIKIKIQTGRDQLCIFRRILSWFQMKNEIQFRLVFCVRFPRSVDQAMDHDCIFSQVIRNCLSECTDRAIWFFCARIRSVRVRLYVSENYFQVYTIRDE